MLGVVGQQYWVRLHGPLHVSILIDSGGLVVKWEREFELLSILIISRACLNPALRTRKKVLPVVGKTKTESNVAVPLSFCLD